MEGEPSFTSTLQEHEGRFKSRLELVHQGQYRPANGFFGSSVDKTKYGFLYCSNVFRKNRRNLTFVRRFDHDYDEIFELELTANFSKKVSVMLLSHPGHLIAM